MHPEIGEMPKIPDTAQLTMPAVLPEQPETLKTLMALCSTLDELVAYKEKLEDYLKENGERIQQLSTKLIPDMMMSIGMSEVTLNTGRKIALKPDIHTSVSKERMPYALAWLRQHNMDSIAKQSIKLDVAFAEAIEQTGMPFTREATIHPSTLLAFVKERLAADDAATFPRELFGVHEGTKAVTTTTR
jgi:hypothetical protein